MADCNYNYTVYSECTCNGRWIFSNNCTKAATSSTAVTSHRTRRYSSQEPKNFASSLTQQHCLLLLLLMELTEHWTKCTVQQPFTVPTDSVQWTVQWTLCGVGATDWMVAVHCTVIHLVVCGQTACCAVSNWLTAWSRVLLKKPIFLHPLKKFPPFCETQIFITVLTTDS